MSAKLAPGQSSECYWITGILTKDIDTVWNEAAIWLHPAVRRASGRYLIQDVYSLIKQQEMQLWVVYRGSQMVAAGTTRIDIYPRKKVLSLPFVGGVNAKAWIHTIEIIKDFARHHGCEEIEFHARRGWMKLFPEFKDYYTSLRLEI